MKTDVVETSDRTFTSKEASDQLKALSVRFSLWEFCNRSLHSHFSVSTHLFM